MKKYDAGFIGAGNMGGALALAAAKKVGGGKVAVSCNSPASSAAAAKRIGCRDGAGDTCGQPLRFSRRETADDRERRALTGRGDKRVRRYICLNARGCEP